MIIQVTNQILSVLLITKRNLEVKKSSSSSFNNDNYTNVGSAEDYLWGWVMNSTQIRQIMEINPG